MNIHHEQIKPVTQHAWSSSFNLIWGWGTIWRCCGILTQNSPQRTAPHEYCLAPSTQLVYSFSAFFPQIYHPVWDWKQKVLWAVTSIPLSLQIMFKWCPKRRLSPNGNSEIQEKEEAYSLNLGSHLQLSGIIYPLYTCVLTFIMWKFYKLEEFRAFYSLHSTQVSQLHLELLSDKVVIKKKTLVRPPTGISMACMFNVHSHTYGENMPLLPKL